MRGHLCGCTARFAAVSSLRVKKPDTLLALLIAIVLMLIALAALLGWAVGNQTASNTKTVTTPSGSMAAPSGHTGGSDLAVDDIGDASRGARLWAAKGCADCHSYGGRGGADAPPLDFMRGHMSAREIADMSGQIWDHLPAMLSHFREEKLPVPSFTQGEMADLVAFLHSGKGARAGAAKAHRGGMQMAGGKGVFLSAGCGACHTYAAADTRATVGPNLDRTLIGKSGAFVRESIVKPNAMISRGYPKGVMPTTYASQLTAREINLLVSFLLQGR